MIERIVKMTFHQSEVEPFIALFYKSRPKILNFRGCIHVELWQDVNDSCVLSTYSRWESEEDLNAYRASATFSGIWKETKKKFSKPPEAISFKKVDKQY